MGYTHYWRISASEVPSQAFGRLALDVKQIIEATDVPLANGMGDAGSRPVITEGAISLNGADGDDFETFYIGVESSGFDFCKTGSRPYDAVVCACLIRAKVQYGDAISISSDGDWDDEWAEGAALTKSVFGEALNPLDED